MPTLQDAKRIVVTARSIESDMPIAQLLCLFVLADEVDGLSLTELARRADITIATASRYIGSLGKMDRHREEGLKLVEAFEDPMERRKKIIRLTPKGKTVISRMLGENNGNISKR